VPESHPRSGSRTVTALLSSVATLSLLVGLVGVAAPAEAKAIKAARPKYSAAIEPLAGYQAQTTCSPTAKPGVADFSTRLLRAKRSTRSMGIVRACSAGGRSEHKEGRAFDWGVNARTAAGRKTAGKVLTWLLKTDKHGNRYAMARRLGIQYIIWNRKIWGSYSADSGWRKYTGSNPHTDHAHFSFTWAGARKKTSFWTGKVGNVGAAPTPTLPRPGTPTTPRYPTPTPTRTTRPPATPSPTPTITPPRPVPAAEAVLLAGPSLTDETISVPATSAGVRTAGSLQAGQTYLVETSGVIRYGSRTTQLADAECSRTASDSSYRRNRSVHVSESSADHLDLYVDGVDLDADPDVNTGSSCDNRTHTYRYLLTPDRTGRVMLATWDPTTLADNEGALTVRVVSAAPRATMDWQVPASAAAGVTSPGGLEADATYVMTVTGTVNAGGGVSSDAECSMTTIDPVWRWNRSVVSTSPSSDHLDVLVDRTDVTFTPVNDPASSVCDATGHSYRYEFTPDETRPVNLRIDDPAWTDNDGSLSVHVERVDPVVGTETVPVNTAAADVKTARSYLAGQALRLTATGTYTYASGVTADAECSALSSSPTSWDSAPSRMVVGGKAMGDVTVDARLPDWVPVGGGACDSATHAYSWLHTPTRSGRLTLGVADANRTDNLGTVTVTISPAGS
jgi:hypothetical protein